jgi:NAD(P)-dependent dehydrogenase (short-subunit alcohol dehydrogenase family)
MTTANQPRPLLGKRALVTGAGAGIGRATALRLAGDGASVALVDCRADVLGAAAEEVRALGADVLEFAVDVGEEMQVAAAFGDVQRSWGGLDCVVSCAGISLDHAGDDRIDRLELEVWERVLRTNLTGMFLVCKHAVRALSAAGGSIVVMGSPTGLYGFASGEHAYSASKGGVHALARVMAGDCASLGIRVNIVVPGFIDTRMNTRVLQDAEIRADVEKSIPLRRVGQPSEVASIVSWLVSDDASYATGGYFTIDGGQTCL